MNYNELHFVSERVRDALLAKQYLRMSVVKAYGGESVAAHFIAREIQHGRDAFQAAKDTREMTAISEGYALLKTKLRAIIPQSFGWWLEIDHDVEMRVRWLWLGHPAVTHSGSVADCDPSIVLALLRLVDWDAEAKEAMASVEDAEAALLKTAQERRRLRLTDSAHKLALPSIEPLAPPTFDQKKIEMGPRRRPVRRLTPEEMTRRLAEAEKTVPKQEHAYDADKDNGSEGIEGDDDEPAPSARAASATPRPAAVAVASEAPQSPSAANESTPEGAPVVRFSSEKRTFPRRGTPGLFLTRAPCLDAPLHALRWEEFDSISAAIHAVRTNPPGTYTGAHVYGQGFIKGGEAVWKAFGDGRPYPNAYRGRKPRRELTRREYDRLTTGTTDTEDVNRTRFYRGA